MCAICRDPRRDASLLCVVEQPRDLFALESAGTYRGRYHVLLGRIAPLEGVGPEQLTIDSLIERVRDGGIQEVIMATNPTLEGDGTALYFRAGWPNIRCESRGWPGESRPAACSNLPTRRS